MKLVCVIERVLIRVSLIACIPFVLGIAACVLPLLALSHVMRGLFYAIDNKDVT